MTDTNNNLSPDAFRNTYRSRGWNNKTLGERWNVTPNYITKIASAQPRAMHWNDAVRGLPMRDNK